MAYITSAERIGIKKGFEQGIQQGIQQGMEQGMQRGMQRGQTQLAKNLIQKGLPLEMISQAMGISSSELQSLLAENDTSH